MSNMQNDRKILLKIDELLDELLKIAKELEDTVLTVTKEKDILLLQNKQDALLEEIKMWDAELEETTNGKKLKQTKEGELLKKKLMQFQKSNNQYIENLKRSRGLIHFQTKNEKD